MRRYTETTLVRYREIIIHSVMTSPARRLDAIEETWDRYRATGDPAAREALILHYAPLVKYVAGRIGARLVDHVDREDLMSYGLFGLIDAIERFEPERGFKFETFATPRIRGAIIDELRNLDWAPRQVRRRGRRLNEVREDLAHRLGRWPTPEEMAEHLDLTEEEVAEAEADVDGSYFAHLDRPLGDPEEGATLGDLIVDDQAVDPLTVFEREDTSRQLAESIQGLSDRERLVVTLYYYEQLTLREIGDILDVTESRICQIHRAAVERLQHRLTTRGVLV